jgi:hypothetical protein
LRSRESFLFRVPEPPAPFFRPTRFLPPADAEARFRARAAPVPVRDIVVLLF